MDEVMRVVDEKIKDLEFCIGILYDALKTQENVLLNNNDIFKSINMDIEVLNSYSNYFNDNDKQFNIFYKICLRHFNDTFSNKDTISREDINKVLLCLNDTKKLRLEINKNSSYSKFFEEIKGISKNLNSIDNDTFLKDSDYTKDALSNYEKLLAKYERLISNINELASDMNKNDFELLNIDLGMNYSGLKANLNAIYKEIIYSNNDIASPLLNKLSRDIISNNYDSTLGSSMVNKVVDDPNKRKNLINNFDMLIESMNKIVDMYEDRRIVKSNNEIDIDFNGDKKEDYGIDILPFVEENYNEHREKTKMSNSSLGDENDDKLTKLITRFEILKRKLARIERTRGSLPKEEVILYNRLESELDELKGGKKNRIKFNYYYGKLNRQIKLYNSNPRRLGLNDTKKRK